MKKLMPALTLSTLLVCPNYGENWTIVNTQTKNINNGIVEKIELMKNGRLTVDSAGTSTIRDMQMFFFNEMASATFNVNSGNLDLNLNIANMNRVENHIEFNVKKNARLTIASGRNQTQLGIFSGIATNLKANIQGTLVGSLSNDSETMISLAKDATMQGDILQGGGTLEARIEGSLDGSIQIASGAQAFLLGNENQFPTKQTIQIKGNISQDSGRIVGKMGGLHLFGTWMQTGGESDVEFKGSRLDSSITISNAATEMDFRKSTLGAISVTGYNMMLGRSSISLYEQSSMGEFTGNDSNVTLSLNEGSSMKSAMQKGRDFTLSANNSKVDGSVSATSAYLTVTLDKKTTITGGISNVNGTSNLNSTDSVIQQNITQTDGTVYLKAKATIIGGLYNQSGGNLSNFVLHESKIDKGVFLTGVNPLPFNTRFLIDMTRSEINNSLTLKEMRGTLTGEIRTGSVVSGGYKQFNMINTNEGKVQFAFIDGSMLNDGIQVKDGNQDPVNEWLSADYMTSMRFDKSTLNGGAISENHSLWLDFIDSSENGDMQAIGGNLVVKGTINSRLKGNISSQNTNLSMILFDRGTQLEGNITQVNGRQEIKVDSARVRGFIRNTNTNTRLYMRRGSLVTGFYEQDGGTLQWESGGNATINGNVTLNEVQTTMSNGDIPSHDETIKGNFTQNGGTLSGVIGGFKLGGSFTQNGGVANIKFNNANFSNPTSINGVTSSKIIFDQGSRLKDYTISDSPKNDNGEIVNLLKLDHVTILDGNFILSHSASKLTVINDSRITGSVISNDPDNDLDLDIGNGGTIGGNIEIEGGSTGANIEGGNIGGDIKITNVDSHFHFKDTTIGGSINIERGNTVMTLDNTSIGRGFKMMERGGKNPSLVMTISNGSSINGDVQFNNTDVYLGGIGEGSTIAGNLSLTDTSLINTKAVEIEDLHPGKEPIFPLSASGLTIQGDFKQEGGVLDFVMSNKSSVIRETSLSNSEFSHLAMDNASTLGKVSINKVSDALISLNRESSQKWDGDGITLIDSKVVLRANERSSFMSNIKVISNNRFPSDTQIFLGNQSELVGNVAQEIGTFLLDARDLSEMRGNIAIKNLEAKIDLHNRSKMFGNLVTSKSAVNITLNNGSEMHSDITSVSTPIINIDANNGSTFMGSIIHNGFAKEGEFDFKMKFMNKSILNNTTSTINGAMQIVSNNSTINSEGIDLVHGQFDLSLDNGSDGTILGIQTGGTNKINIVTTNRSDSSINTLSISDTATLTLVANLEARISGELLTKRNSLATLVSLGNATIDFDVIPEDNAILKISLNGGKFLGKVIQENPLLGEATLGANGGFGGRWIMVDDSALRTLVVSNSPSLIQDQGAMLVDVENSPISMVDMTKDRNEAVVGRRIGKAMVGANVVVQDGETRARTLSLGSLGGVNGVFRVYTDIGAGLSDKVKAQRGVGNHIIQVYYNPTTYTTNLDGKYIVVAHIDDESTTANFVGGPTEIGNNRYETELEKVPAKEGDRGWDWILGGVKNAGPSYGTKVIASILQSQYRSFVIQTETLNQRLGELRELNRIDGLWARYFMGVNSTKETSNHIRVDDHYYSGWLGYDQNSLSLKGQNFLGFALSYAFINPDSKDYIGSIHNVGFNFYDVFVTKNDFYVDIVAKYIMSYGMYDVNYYSLSKNSPKYFNHKFIASVEIGKKFKLGQERRNYFYLQPEAQITSGYILGNELDFVDASNTRIHATLGDTFPVIMRAGLTGAYAMEYSSFKGDVRLGASFVYEVGTGGSVDLDDGNSVAKYRYGGDFHLLLQAGTNFILNESSRIYFEASTGFFGDANTTYAINAGVRFNFGPKNTRRLRIPSSTPPPPPPKLEYDPRNIPVITDNTKMDIKNNNETKRTPTYNSDYFINTRKNYRDKTSIQR